MRHLRAPQAGDHVCFTVEGMWVEKTDGPYLRITDDRTGATVDIPPPPVATWKITSPRCTAEDDRLGRCDLDRHDARVLHAVRVLGGIVARWG